MRVGLGFGLGLGVGLGYGARVREAAHLVHGDEGGGHEVALEGRPGEGVGVGLGLGIGLGFERSRVDVALVRL